MSAFDRAESAEDAPAWMKIALWVVGVALVGGIVCGLAYRQAPRKPPGEQCASLCQPVSVADFRVDRNGNLESCRCSPANPWPAVSAPRGDE